MAVTNRILVPQYAWRVSELIDWTAPASGSTDTGKVWVWNNSTSKYEATTTLTNYTLVTPTIASTGWANANHAHTGSTSGGQLDHGTALTGLGDNDHPQYFLASGVSGFGATLIDDADATAARSTLGLGTMATAAETSYPLLTGARAMATAGLQAFTSGIVTGIVRPPSDSTTAFRAQNAAGSSDVLTVNTTNESLLLKNSASSTPWHIFHGVPGNYDGYLKFGRSLATFDFALTDGGNFLLGSNKVLQLQGVAEISAYENANTAIQTNSGAYLTLSGRDAIYFMQSFSERMRIDATGIGFYGAAAVARQLLATGAGATVDQVITALQNLGLLRQS